MADQTKLPTTVYATLIMTTEGGLPSFKVTHIRDVPTTLDDADFDFDATGQYTPRQDGVLKKIIEARIPVNSGGQSRASGRRRKTRMNTRRRSQLGGRKKK